MEEGWSAFKVLTSKPTGKRPLGRPRTKLEWTLKRYVLMRGIGLIRLRIGIIEEPLWTRHWTYRFHKPWSGVNIKMLVLRFRFLDGCTWRHGHLLTIRSEPKSIVLTHIHTCVTILMALLRRQWPPVFFSKFHVSYTLVIQGMRLSLVGWQHNNKECIFHS